MATENNDDLQDMLGFGDANSSRGDLSAIFESAATTPATTPRRRSHRPTPRRHSPQVQLPTPIAPPPAGDENSPELFLAFTPGKTRLDDKSLEALQVCQSNRPIYCVKCTRLLIINIFYAEKIRRGSRRRD